LGITFLRIATTNKPGAINPSISFCSFGLNFSQGIITLVSPAYVHRSIKWWPHYRRSHDGSVSFRTQFGERRIRNSDRPVNPGFATPLLHYADDLHRHRLRRQAIFLLLLTLHKLFIMQRFFLLLSLVCTIFCAQENDPAGLYPLTSPRLDGGLRQHFITPCQGLRHHSAVLH